MKTKRWAYKKLVKKEIKSKPIRTKGKYMKTLNIFAAFLSIAKTVINYRNKLVKTQGKRVLLNEDKQTNAFSDNRKKVPLIARNREQELIREKIKHLTNA